MTSSNPYHIVRLEFAHENCRRSIWELEKEILGVTDAISSIKQMR